ncbi:2-oxo-tetronate isomerase [Bordetella holmesii]|uniref:Xylose isomerase-like TIM barrel domain protein n=2 Tax=Bordetella holmesii TaxID=35814 RepID=A0A158LZK4_9BORD|nr:2-oxo-tetronate isomerase [Bordetella holmesii]AHV92179.1 xylose isomerase-like TIM barrel family protein [Bordetella holmesii ATCC 51541]EWM47741.1 xylose isomerase-like TIM barrel family protein [Bordetella holmesii 35009]EWM51913.1 xylose isomerase-like TIM barrel family protein [Bordetella holmesii 70147]AMD46037.1 hydroxypyruvate isomerase [Bordetella holmesii H558]AMD48552.1 hydroxypyruvate isomerase [Bordetella holmesii F627]
MPRFAANLSTLYQDIEMLDRCSAAARDGFRGVEMQSPYGYPTALWRDRLQSHDLELILINAPAGDAARGERGLACLPGRQEDFRAAVEQALEYAVSLMCPRVHVMAGCPATGSDPAALRATYIDNLAYAARLAAAVDVDILIEPINPRDIPGYYLNHQAEAHAVALATGAANVKVQMDLYHCQILEGDVSMRLRHYIPQGRVGHVQIAGVPLRQEPDQGELNYPYLFQLLDELAYPGWVGCEYRPAGDTRAGLGWLHAARRASTH